MVSSTLLTLTAIPAIYALMKGIRLPVTELESSQEMRALKSSHRHRPA
ncbi:hypothetical protein [Methylocystis sp.]